MALTAGDFWNITNPKKPKGELDPNAILRIPMGVSDMLDKMATTYADHQLIPQAPLVVVEKGAYATGYVYPLISCDPITPEQLGQTFTLVLRVIGADGQQDDRTMYLKIKEL